MAFCFRKLCWACVRKQISTALGGTRPSLSALGCRPLEVLGSVKVKACRGTVPICQHRTDEDPCSIGEPPPPNLIDCPECMCIITRAAALRASSSQTCGARGGKGPHVENPLPSPTPPPGACNRSPPRRVEGRNTPNPKMNRCWSRGPAWKRDSPSTDPPSKG